MWAAPGFPGQRNWSYFMPHAACSFATALPFQALQGTARQARKIVRHNHLTSSWMAGSLYALDGVQGSQTFRGSPRSVGCDHAGSRRGVAGAHPPAWAIGRDKGGGSGQPVTFTVDSTSGKVCSQISSNTFRFNTPGTCTIDANQASNELFLAAHRQQQTITIPPPSTSPPA